jgi:hypothetical protein
MSSQQRQAREWDSTQGAYTITPYQGDATGGAHGAIGSGPVLWICADDARAVREDAWTWPLP